MYPMKKIRIDDCIFHSKIKNHLKIKNDILFEINKCPNKSLHLKSQYYTDSISKLDWYKNSDFNRPWVKIFLPEFCKDVEEIIFSMCYNRINLVEWWFQQYLEGDTHGWHIHGDHFTGVYYLEFPEGCSQTEIVSPYNLTTKKIDVVEGDFIVFPSHYIHRGLPNTKKRKTIISYNFSIDGSPIDG